MLRSTSRLTRAMRHWAFPTRPTPAPSRALHRLVSPETAEAAKSYLRPHAPLLSYITGMSLGMAMCSQLAVAPGGRVVLRR